MDTLETRHRALETANRYVLRQADAATLIAMTEFRRVDYLASLDTLERGWETRGSGEGFAKLRQVAVS